MKILIDARSVQPKLQGAGRYTLNLLLGLSFIESPLEFLVWYSHPYVRKTVDRLGGPQRTRFVWLRGLGSNQINKKGLSRKELSVFESTELFWILRLHRVQVIHDTSARGVRWTGRPILTTVHELEALHFTDTGYRLRKRMLKHSFSNSKLILPVSETLAEELESGFHISRPKMKVITNSVSPSYFERPTKQEIKAMRERFNLPDEYFLCVTANRSSKNVGLALDLAAKWKGPETFVLTLKSEDFQKEASENTAFIGFIEEFWLKAMYSQAKAVIIPSLYEGFSFPPIEALACGAIPVVSDIPVHREILGKILPSELFFDPKNPTSLKKSLEAVIHGGDFLKLSILDKFRTVRELYSFKDFALKMEQTYREVAGV